MIEREITTEMDRKKIRKGDIEVCMLETLEHVLGSMISNFVF